MDWALVFVLQVTFLPFITSQGLFKVEAKPNKYSSELGGDVVMTCRFDPVPLNPLTGLKVYWYWTTNNLVRKVYVMEYGKNNLSLQDVDFQGRVKLNTEELQNGLAMLQVSRLKMNDSGTYQCLMETELGTDYKKMTLTVTAPYKAVTRHIQEVADRDELLLTCQSEGYPESPVVWQDGQLQNIISNTTSVSTPDQLFKVTSQIHIKSLEKNNYTCTFTNDGHNATFHIPDDIPNHPVKNDALIVILIIGLILLIIVAVLTYQQRKGSGTHNTGNRLVNGRGGFVSAPVCLQIGKENDEDLRENLGASLKAHYADYSFSTEMGRHWDHPHRLQNNEGQPATLQSLLPEAEEMLFLEGPPGSGKTALAHILISSWAKGPTDTLTNLLDLSILHLLLYVDCSTAKGDLFQEIISQLSLGEKVSTEELRTVLTRSNDALLLLDGYREGDQLFDDSLKTFISERRGCRVLVMACPGHCPILRETVGTRELLKLQTQTVKY
ncbi:CD276 antigen homolog [Scomber scombrus]|uniref:CD276 antigen homolog n=1 Tax=Scomber scombrus TaxID=13677 RepID=UPI002DD9C899|nr:CD276 antigen homolog [Scomber scombrus]